jgi:uncharacterized alpha-E superfamily protein
MLSRVANSLFWLSRYLERADNTARLVEVNLQILLDQAALDEKSLLGYWMPIIQSTGDEDLFRQHHRQVTGDSVAEFLVFQQENGNSIVSSVSQARENARMVRDQITGEFWEELNQLYLFLNSAGARKLWRESPFDFFQQVKESSLLLQGLTDSSIMRNEGWYFVQVGRYLERADKASRILDVHHATFPDRGPPPAGSTFDALAWAAVLRSSSAWDAYKAVHGADIHPPRVAEFLLLSADFPRAVRFCVEELNTSLRRLSGVSEGRFRNDAEKLAGRLLAELQFSGVDDVLATGLHRFIDELQTKLNAIGAALFQAYIFQPFQAVDDLQQQQQQQ